MTREAATALAFAEQDTWMAAGGHREIAPRSPAVTQVLIAVHTLTADQGYPPSVREVQQKLGWKSPSHTLYWLNRCRMRNHVDWEAGKARTLHLIGEAANVVPKLARKREKVAA